MSEAQEMADRLVEKIEALNDFNSLRLHQLECDSKDYEARLRKLEEASTQFRTLVAIASGGGLISIITLLKELLR